MHAGPLSELLASDERSKGRYEKTAMANRPLFLQMQAIRVRDAAP